MSSMEGSTKSSNCQSCGVCGVKIDAQGTVHFAFGKPGSRERLHARVCQHVSDSQCINQEETALAPITSADGYGTIEDASASIDQALSNATMMAGYGSGR